MPTIAIIVGLYLFIACVFLLIDRCRLMVSSLAHTIYPISSIFEKISVDYMAAALAAFFMGGLLLLLSAY